MTHSSLSRRKPAVSDDTGTWLVRQDIPSKQSGVALAIVVWFIAGMSLLVAGIVSHAQVDTRMAQLHVARAKVSAVGDGAIQLVMADLASGKIPANTITDMNPVNYRIGDLDSMVRLTPGKGLIDLNTASQEVLSTLFAMVGSVDRGEAEFLANNVVNWREGSVGRGRRNSGGSRFDEIEDLLRVDGFDRALLDGVRDYVVAGRAAAGRTNWLYSPKEVLAVLEKLDPGQYANLANRRSDTQAQEDSLRGSSAMAADAFRVDAQVRYGGRMWMRRRWVVMVSGANSLLGWQTIRTESPRVIPG